MDVFGMDAAQLAAAGATWTTREILQQPAAWSEIEMLLSERAAELREFLQPLTSARDLQVVLTGAGTSAHVGACLAPALRRAAPHTVAAVPTTDLVASPESYLTPAVRTLLVSFARSGSSPESVAAAELAERYLADCSHLLVTCDATGSLYRRFSGAPNARAILLPEKVNDRSFAMTSSFSSMLLAAGLALSGWPQPSVRRAASLASQLLSGRGRLLRELVDARYERIVYLGSRELQGLARESALKMLEMTDGQVVAVAESTLGFRHGPKTILNDRALVVVFISSDSYTQQYDWELVRELRRDAVAGRIIALCGQVLDGAHADDVSLSGDVAGALHDLELCLPYIVFAQSLALLRAISCGVSPDSPNAAGTVSRVVKGVTIHPWRRSM